MPIENENSEEKRTIRDYDKHATHLRVTEPHISRFSVDSLRAVRSLMDEDPLCLDVGCGHGRMVPAFRNAGISRYVGIDPSRNCIALARQAYPDEDFRVMSLYDLPKRFPAGHFDSFFAIMTLAHVPYHKMGKALSCIRSVTRQGGVGCIALPWGNYTSRSSGGKMVDDSHPGSFVTVHGWETEKITSVITENGFSINYPACEEHGMNVIGVRAK